MNPATQENQLQANEGLTRRDFNKRLAFLTAALSLSSLGAESGNFASLAADQLEQLAELPENAIEQLGEIVTRKETTASTALELRTAKLSVENSTKISSFLGTSLRASDLDELIGMIESGEVESDTLYDLLHDVRDTKNGFDRVELRKVGVDSITAVISFPDDSNKHGIFTENGYQVLDYSPDFFTAKKELLTGIYNGGAPISSAIAKTSAGQIDKQSGRLSKLAILEETSEGNVIKNAFGQRKPKVKEVDLTAARVLDARAEAFAPSENGLEMEAFDVDLGNYVTVAPAYLNEEAINKLSNYARNLDGEFVLSGTGSLENIPHITIKNRSYTLVRENTDARFDLNRSYLVDTNALFSPESMVQRSVTGRLGRVFSVANSALLGRGRGEENIFAAGASEPERITPEFAPKVQEYSALKMQKFTISEENKSTFTGFQDVAKLDEFGNHIAEYYAVPANSESFQFLLTFDKPNSSLRWLMSNTDLNKNAEVIVSFQNDPEKGLVFIPILRSIAPDEIYGLEAGTLEGLDGSIPDTESPLVLTLRNDVEGLNTAVLTISTEFLAALDQKIANKDDKAILAQLNVYDVVLIKTDENGNLKEMMTNTAENIDGINYYYVYQFHSEGEQPQNTTSNLVMIPIATAEPITSADLFGKVAEAVGEAFIASAEAILPSKEGKLTLAYSNDQVTIYHTQALIDDPDYANGVPDNMYMNNPVMIQRLKNLILQKVGNDLNKKVFLGTDATLGSMGQITVGELVESKWNIVRMGANWEGTGAEEPAIDWGIIDGQPTAFVFWPNLNETKVFEYSEGKTMEANAYSNLRSVASNLVKNELKLGKITSDDEYYLLDGTD